MDNLLKSSKVDKRQVKSLAGAIANFHATSKRIFTPFDLSIARDTFNDIEMIRKVVRKNLGESYTKLISLSKKWSGAFLKRHQARLQQRINQGLKRDVHGDLHSGNIFLYSKPVLFDCIEFNDRYRQIDVLYEVAFLCMELEFYGKKLLADNLLQEYLKRFPCVQSREDRDIFIYFKCLRANVRAKVHALQLRQVHAPEKRNRQLADVGKYLDLMKRYMKILKGN